MKASDRDPRMYQGLEVLRKVVIFVLRLKADEELEGDGGHTVF